MNVYARALVLSFAGVLVALGTGCSGGGGNGGGGGGGSPPPAPAGIGPAGGTVTSGDAKVVIPPGALTAELLVNDVFNVAVGMTSYTYTRNLAQGESYARAYLRDPVDFDAAISIELSGLEQLRVNEDPVHEPAPAECASPDPHGEADVLLETGKLTLYFLGARDRADAVAEEPDGKLVVGGFVGSGTGNVFAVVRLAQ